MATRKGFDAQVKALLEVATERRRGRRVPPQRAREIRLQAGISMRELGEVLGVSYGAIARWEKGRSPSHRDLGTRYYDVLEALERILQEEPPEPVASDGERVAS